ncbi:MAG: YabP/YqfC family sporulation protein [Bacillota bacterium]|nr:YabP/YqfC family sporulation protein [Bacillota bacterium]
MRPVSEKIKRRVAGILDLPSEVMLDHAIINLMGDTEAKITNHKGLVQYSPVLIKASSLQGFIEVIGENLEIASFSSDEIKIVGRINQVMLK